MRMHGHSTKPRLWPRLILTFAGTLLCLQLFYTYSSSGSDGAAPNTSKRRFKKQVLYTEYQQYLPVLLAHVEPHFVVFTSGKFEGSKHPWCRDCRAALPVIREMVWGVGGSLLEVSVGTSVEWKNSNHPCRVDPVSPVKYIPTLVHWTEAGPSGMIANSLTDDESEESLRIIIAEFMKETAAGKRFVDRVTQEVIKSGGKACGGC